MALATDSEVGFTFVEGEMTLHNAVGIVYEVVIQSVCFYHGNLVKYRSAGRNCRFEKIEYDPREVFIFSNRHQNRYLEMNKIAVLLVLKKDVMIALILIKS